MTNMVTDNSRELRLAMLGMVEGNGHPYSWSAIFNGYEREVMGACPYPVIAEYLGREPSANLQIPGARVTHIWADEAADARHVADAARIPHVVTHPEDVIGEVDAVLIATDKGHEHVARCRPFVEAGVPIFVDKPLADNAADLQTFRRWVGDGAPILSSSCMRYCKEFEPYRRSTRDLGDIGFASITTPKCWERYGIHALEAIYPILGPGFLSARNVGEAGRDVVHFRHRYGADVVVIAREEMNGSFGVLQLCGMVRHAHAAMSDTFWAFKAQLEAFVHYVQSGVRPFAFEETAELIAMLIAGQHSREASGREILIADVMSDTA